LVLRQELVRLHAERGEAVQPGQPVIYSERGGGLTANTVTVWFHTLYHTLGLTGCSSHSGRRTFITRAAKKVVEAGGSLRDVQQLAGHASLSMTQRYIEGDSDAKRKLVNLV
jgi:integrase/recombinase XerC